MTSIFLYTKLKKKLQYVNLGPLQNMVICNVVCLNNSIIFYILFYFIFPSMIYAKVRLCEIGGRKHDILYFIYIFFLSYLIILGNLINMRPLCKYWRPR
jgi:hypothetical protein